MAVMEARADPAKVRPSLRAKELLGVVPYALIADALLPATLRSAKVTSALTSDLKIYDRCLLLAFAPARRVSSVRHVSQLALL